MADTMLDNLVLNSTVILLILQNQSQVQER